MTESISWVDPDGGVTPLDVDWDLSERFAPPTFFEEEDILGREGALLRSTRHEPRDFTLVFQVAADDRVALRTALRDLVGKMDPHRGAGFIRNTAPDGQVRQIGCYVTDGLGLLEQPGDSGPQMQKISATFHAPLPYWLDLEDIAGDLPPGGWGVVQNVLNDGDVETWPVWRLAGPGNTISLENVTTGRKLTLSSSSLGPGETLVIDTRPGRKSLTMADQNWYPKMTDASTLWPLAPGNNQVKVSMFETNSSSTASIAFQRRYLAP